MAVVSSAMYGTVSGSSVADVYATGVFTIPLMKKIGYRPEIAGAIEATASCGGPLMPPVMGAGAFIMAELTGIPYSTIIVAAILPALLFYLGVLATVHWEALKHGIGTMAADVPPLAQHPARAVAALRAVLHHRLLHARRVLAVQGRALQPAHRGDRLVGRRRLADDAEAHLRDDGRRHALGRDHRQPCWPPPGSSWPP